MASIFISPPGSEFGPCISCTHTDCATLRTIAECICDFCKQPIGYDKHLFEDATKGNYVHESCLLKKLEEKKLK